MPAHIPESRDTYKGGGDGERMRGEPNKCETITTTYQLLFEPRNEFRRILIKEGLREKNNGGREIRMIGHKIY
jgi:hypothetical protein